MGYSVHLAEADGMPLGYLGVSHSLVRQCIEEKRKDDNLIHLAGKLVQSRHRDDEAPGAAYVL